MAGHMLEVNDLLVRFHTSEGVVRAVNGISFFVDRGETVALVGESGCGKSVSMLSIMGLLPQPPAEIQGRILFQNRDLVTLSNAEMRQVRGNEIAMVFQDPMTSLNPVLTIGYQTREPLETHFGMDQSAALAEAESVLELVGIPHAGERLGDYPFQFSGGMRQRVMIAMALSCKPALLIADEPTTALDVTIQAQILELVKELREKVEMSLIWITHDLGIVAGLADRVMVMYAGYLVEEGPVDDLYERPTHPYTMGLLESVPSPDQDQAQKLSSIEGAPPDLVDLPSGCPFAPRCKYRIARCEERMPPAFEVAEAHTVACWVDPVSGRGRNGHG